MNDPHDPMGDRSTRLIWASIGLILAILILATVCRALALAAVVPLDAWRWDVLR